MQKLKQLFLWDSNDSYDREVTGSVEWPEDTNFESDKPECIYDRDGRSFRVGDAISSGGEGSIYTMPDFHGGDTPPLILKKYHSGTLEDPKKSRRIRRKVETQATMQAFRDHGRFAWPRASAFDETGQWIGFVMYQMDGSDMDFLGSPALFLQNRPSWNGEELVTLALNLVQAVHYCHHHGVIIGDINPRNFMVAPGKPKVSMIDCDSYQISHEHPTPGGILLYTPPELLESGLSYQPRTIEQESFSLAILLYYILMLGQHPYSHRGGGDPVENMRHVNCPILGDHDCKMPMGPWFPLWRHHSPDIRKAFAQTFGEGNRAPRKRVTPEKWIQLLSTYKKQMQRGKRQYDIHHIIGKWSQHRNRRKQQSHS